MVQNLKKYHISEYRLNLITSHLSDTHVNPVENSPLYRVENSLPQGITRTAIRVFCRLTARWVMGSYLLAERMRCGDSSPLSKGQMMNGSAHRQRPNTNKRLFDGRLEKRLATSVPV